MDKAKSNLTTKYIDSKGDLYEKRNSYGKK